MLVETLIMFHNILCLLKYEDSLEINLTVSIIISLGKLLNFQQ